jgi:hypothetical protein
MCSFQHTRAALAIVCITKPVFAAAAVKVVEGGSPMTLTLDQSRIKADETTFLVHNDAMSEKHEMVHLKLKSTTPKIVVTAAMGARKREKAERNRRSIRTEARRGWRAES